MTTISVGETPDGCRNRSSKSGVHEGRTAATIVRRLYGPIAEIEWDGPNEYTGRVVIFRDGSTDTLATIELIDGNR